MLQNKKTFSHQKEFLMELGRMMSKYGMLAMSHMKSQCY